jgi:pteridine reductase
MDVKNKKILVTGGARRIGAEISRALALEGADVIVHYFHSVQDAERLKQELQNQQLSCDLVKANLSNFSELREMVTYVFDHFDSLDGLVCNAAIFPHTPFFSVREEEWDHVMTVNLKSHFFLSQMIGQKMVEQKSGKMVFITDVSADIPWPGYLPYTISKAGVNHLIKGLAKVLAPYAQVNGIAPGIVLPSEDISEAEKEFYRNQTLLKRIGSPEDIARTVVFLFENSDFMTGTIIPVDGGYSIK